MGRSQPQAFTMKHNNMIAKEHFKKYWQRYVKTWFDQPAKKKARRLARQKKAAAVAPRPVAGSLRSLVHPPTARYNIKVRLGRGFSLAEIKAAGLGKKEAQSLGIAVDHRRRNKSVEGQEANVQRLREYRSKLVVFPKHAAHQKKGWVDTSAADTVVEQVSGKLMSDLPKTKKPKARAITAEEAGAHTVRMLKAPVTMLASRDTVRCRPRPRQRRLSRLVSRKPSKRHNHLSIAESDELLL